MINFLVIITLIVLNVHNYIHVNIASRMKLAIYLVKAANNELYDEVLAKAAKNWRVEEGKQNNLVKH
jgi:hypothetical protein